MTRTRIHHLMTALSARVLPANFVAAGPASAQDESGPGTWPSAACVGRSDSSARTAVFVERLALDSGERTVVPGCFNPGSPYHHTLPEWKIGFRPAHRVPNGFDQPSPWDRAAILDYEWGITHETVNDGDVVGVGSGRGFVLGWRVGDRTANQNETKMPPALRQPSRAVAAATQALAGLRCAAVCASLVACIAAAPLPLSAQSPDTRLVRVSIASDGSQADGPSDAPAISANGRFVVFSSSASNLVDGDTNGASDVFWHDRDANGNGVFDEPGGVETRRLSLGLGGNEANGPSWAPSISGSGRYVAFVSRASNLVDGDSNGLDDVFRHDTHSGATMLLSVGLGGTPANGHSSSPSINGDGQVVAFDSQASNLVVDDNNGVSDVFVHGLGDAIRRVSVTSSGQEANGGSWMPSISAMQHSVAGHVIGFVSMATNLDSTPGNETLDVYAHATRTGLTFLGSTVATANSYVTGPHVSATGSLLTFASPASNLVAGDVNGAWDVFTSSASRSRLFNAQLVSLGAQDIAGDADATAGQRHHSRAVFTSFASNLVPGASGAVSDIYVRDVPDVLGTRNGNLPYQPLPSTTRLASRSPLTGGSGNGDSRDAVLASGLAYLAFVSDASDLVPGDINGHADIFVHDIDGGTPPDHANVFVTISGPNMMSISAAHLLVVHIYNFGPGSVAGTRLRIRTYTPPPADGSAPVVDPFDGVRVDALNLQEHCTPGIPDTVPGGRPWCLFHGPIPPGAVVHIPILVSIAFDKSDKLVLDASDQLVLEAFVGVEVVSSETPDPFHSDNRASFDLGVYTCTGAVRCPIDEFYCSSLVSPPADALPKRNAGRLSRLLQKASTFVPHLPTYYRVRDRVMRGRTEGERLVDLYYLHADEVTSIVVDDPVVRGLALEALRAWEPALRLATDADAEWLDSYITRAEQVAAVEAFLDALAGAGSGALTVAIAAERARLPGPLVTGVALREVLDRAFGQTLSVFGDDFENE